jgi:hypothetical protein
MPANLPPGLPIVPDGADDDAPFPMTEDDFESAVSDERLHELGWD